MGRAFAFFFVVTAALAVAAAFPLVRKADMSPVVAGCIGLNAATLLIYAYDKVAAVRTRRSEMPGKGRVPEALLLGLAMLGGGVGAWIAILALGHKKTKQRFRTGVPAILLLEVGIAALAVWVWPAIGELRPR